MKLNKAYKYNPINGNPLKIVDDFLLEDTRTGLPVFLNAKPTVNAIIKSGNEILLVKRNIEPKKGCYDLPGGFLNPDESLEKGLIRELNEELGLVFTKQSLEYHCSYPNIYKSDNIDYYTLDVTFIINVTGQNLKLKSSDDINNFQFFSIEKIPFNRIAFNSILISIKDYITKNEKS